MPEASAEPAPAEEEPPSYPTAPLTPEPGTEERPSTKRENDFPEEPDHPDKRQRVELLELYHTAMIKTAMLRKRKECTAKDFTGQNFHRLQKSITKEVNQNLASGAYKLLDLGTSQEIWETKSDRIMGSRYVLTKKPLEESDIAKAKVEDLLLDDDEHGPAKAKCRHVMQGFSEPEALVKLTLQPRRSLETQWFLLLRFSAASVGLRVFLTIPRPSTLATASTGNYTVHSPVKVFQERIPNNSLSC